MPDLAEKSAFGETSLMDKIVVTHFYFTGRQISHRIACSIFFLEIRSFNPFWDVFRMRAYILLSDSSGENFKLQVFI